MPVKPGILKVERKEDELVVSYRYRDANGDLQEELIHQDTNPMPFIGDRMDMDSFDTPERENYTDFWDIVTGQLTALFA